MKTSKAIKILNQFGFTIQQARVFYAGLTSGPSLMAELARLAKVPRSSAYYLMQELLRRGFFRTKKRGKRTYYIATSGKRLLEMVREREHLIKQLLRLLQS